MNDQFEQRRNFIFFSCSTSYSLVDSVNNRPRSNPITSKDWLEEGLDELDKLIQEKRKNNGNSASWSIGNGNIGDIDMMDYGRIPSTSSSSGYATSSGNIGNKPEKRKLTEDEKDNQRVRNREKDITVEKFNFQEMKENAKRAREAEKEKKAIEKDQKKGEMLKKREEKEVLLVYYRNTTHFSNVSRNQNLSILTQ